jgi:hypothetical protein
MHKAKCKDLQIEVMHSVQLATSKAERDYTSACVRVAHQQSLAVFRLSSELPSSLKVMVLPGSIDAAPYSSPYRLLGDLSSAIQDTVDLLETL